MFDSTRKIQVTFVAVLALAVVVDRTHAQVNYFWNDPGGGAFNDAGNWNSPFPGTFPAIASRAIFDLSSGYTVTFPVNPNQGTVSSVRRGNVTFDLQGNNYTLGDMFVGEFADNVAEVAIVDGTLNPINTILGEVDPSVGAVIVGEGGRFEPNAFRIGNHGTGSLLIQDGGRATAAGTRVGNQLTGSGTLRVSGTDGSGNRSSFVDASHIIIGASGHGEMHISGGALVETNPNTAAEQSDAIALLPGPGGGLGATGEVTIDGAAPDGTPSTWTSTGPLLIGNLAGGSFAQGSMTITNGGQVTHTRANVLGSTEAPSRIEIRGTDAADNPSKWTLTSDSLDLVGELLVADGAAFEQSSRGMTIGTFEGSEGRVTISGTSAAGVRSSYTGTGYTVGNHGTGELIVSNGAIALSPGIISGMFVGARSTSHGSVLITGKDAFDNPSTVIIGRNITIGDEGSAEVTVSDGGVLQTGFDDPLSFGFIALRDSADPANVLVTGEGSSWSHARNLYVGGSAAVVGGFAKMTVDDQGTIDIGLKLKVWNTSELNINGGMLTADVLELTAGSELQFGIGGTQPSVDHGWMRLGDDALIDGNLQIALLDSFLPTATDTFTLLDAIDVQGVFENVASGSRLLTQDLSGSFQVDYGFGSPFGPGKIVLSDFASNTLTADVDGDFDVDGADFLAIQRSNSAMITQWESQFGTDIASPLAVSPALAKTQAIPEPSTWAMLSLGAMALLRRREIREGQHLSAKTTVAREGSSRKSQRLLVLVAALSLASAAQTTHAQIQYTWNDPAGGAFNDSNNWDSLFPGNAPDVFGSTIFDLPNAYVVNFSRNERTSAAHVRRGNVTFDLAGNTYITQSTSSTSLVVGELADNVAELAILAGTLDTAATMLGAVDPSFGSIVVGLGGRLLHDSLIVGERGTGQLLIQDGGQVITGHTRVGNRETGSGTIEVTGGSAATRSRFISSGSLVIGAHHRGVLRVTGGGLVETNPPDFDDADAIGLFPDVTGTVAEVYVEGTASDGTPSTWNSTGQLLIGSRVTGGPFAQGIMTITGGGQVQHAEAVIHGTDDAPSRVEIRGTDAVGNSSRWTLSSGDLNLDGEVTVADGGSLEAVGGVSIGPVFGTGGSLTISGTASNVVRSSYTGGSISVGQDGGGELHVTDGAIATLTGNGSLTIGNKSTGHGTVRITGKDALGNRATMIVPRRLTVGRSGTASLTVADGGLLHSGFNGADAFGSVASLDTDNPANITVSGAESTWSHDNNLFVGGLATKGGIATLTVEDRATVDIGQTLKVWNTSTLEVNGGTLSADVLELTAGSELQFGIGGTQAAVEHGQILLSDDASIDGDLQIELLDGFLPTANTEFTLLDAIDVMGTFENVAPGARLLTTDRSGSFQVDYGASSPFDPSQIVLSEFAVNTLTADFDADFDVDADDLTQWQGDFGASGNSDANGDNDSDGADFLVWQRQLGDGASTLASSQVVPEPSTVVLLVGLIVVGLFSQRGVLVDREMDLKCFNHAETASCILLRGGTVRCLRDVLFFPVIE